MSLIGSPGLFNPNIRRWEPKSEQLIIAAQSSSGLATVDFRVSLPSSRMRCAVSIVFVATSGPQVTDLSTMSATLWLRTGIDDDVLGCDIPVTNLEGTSLSPTSIPATVGLVGYSREFVTAGDSILGTLKSQNHVTLSVKGVWYVKASFEPEAWEPTEDQWNAVRNLARVTVKGAAQTI